MKKLFSICFVSSVFLLPVVSKAVPVEHQLISPDGILPIGNGLLVVGYTAPCEINEAVRAVMTHDDSGDRTIAVGIVYSADEGNCKSGPKKAFRLIVDPQHFGYAADGDFQPMNVKGQKAKRRRSSLSDRK